MLRENVKNKTWNNYINNGFVISWNHNNRNRLDERLKIGDVRHFVTYI